MKARACVTIAACAILLLTPAPAAAQSSGSDEWEFMIAPYLWASALDGRTGLGPVTSEVDAGFSEIVDVLDGGFLAHFEAHKGRWTILSDLVFLDLGVDLETPPGQVNLEQLIFEAAAGYRIREAVDLLFGARYNDLELGIDLTGPMGTSIAGETDWTDGLVGVRWMPDLGKGWGLSLRGDVASGDSDLTWQIRAVGTYRASKLITIAFGYRVMDVDVETGSGLTRFVYDLEFSGVEAGVAFHF